MKKRRTLIISLLLVAALCLGVGYAAMSTELSITGYARSRNTENVLNVNFIDAEKDDTGIVTATAAESTVSYTSKAATFGISNFAEDDFVVFTYTVKNEAGDDIGATLLEEPTPAYTLNIGEGTTTTIQDHDEIANYIAIEIEYFDASGNAWVFGDSGTILGHNEEMTVVITVTQVAPLIDLLTINDFVMNMNWTAVYDMA